MPRAKKTFRNPNGYGTVYNLGGKRRKPWVAKVHVRTEYAPETKKGFRQVYKTIGYFETKDDGVMALLKYRQSPDSFDRTQSNKGITFAEVYDQWLEYIRKKKSDNAITQYGFAYNNLKKIHNQKIADIRLIHFQSIIDDCKLSKSSKLNMKKIMVNTCEFAEMNDIINKNYAKFVIVEDNRKSDMHKPFTKEEIDVLWKNANFPYVDTILIMIYTGLRIQELLDLHCDYSVDLNKKVLVGGSKTEAGKERVVPIHNRIFPFVVNRYKKGEYLILNANSKKMKYDNYRNNYFDKIMRKLKMDHLPHDCRHTFATLLNNANANSTSITKLIGHKSFETTEKVYTHKDIEELRKAIESVS